VSVPYLMHGCDSGRAGPTELWVIERLTNRVHPTRHRNTGIDTLRRLTGDLIVSRVP